MNQQTIAESSAGRARHLNRAEVCWMKSEASENHA